jgi:glycosyltransferase involved in cell wall biosynthesis
MKKILYVERKFSGFFSLEKVFRQVANELPQSGLDASFQQVEHGAGLKGMLSNLLSFKPKPADLYHITGDITYIALRLPAAKTILTIPDISILKYRTGIRRYVLKKLFFDWPVRKAKYVTAISEATRLEVVKETGCPPDKVRTILLPIDDVFRAEPKPEFNTAKVNLLQMGALPYKNLPNLIRAIEGLSCTLTIIGKLDPETEKLLKEKGIDYHNESQLDDAAIRELYRTADIVTFCSVFEGFGLPIIEAQAMRTPVITSDVEPMKGVAGDGALLVDPHDPASIRKAIDSLVADPSLRDALVERGSQNVKRFAPAVIAQEYANLYLEIMRDGQ